MSDRDYYEILGLTPQADGPMVDGAYWHLARKYQSLISSDVSAITMLDDLNEAYGVLGTPRLRDQYDAFRDEVLLQTGMIRPVEAKPRRKAVPEQTGEERASPAIVPKLPALNIPHGQTYLLAGVIAALAFAGLWQGVNPVFVLGALVAGLALALFPTLRQQWSEIHITFPSLPAGNPPETEPPVFKAPEMKTPPPVKAPRAKQVREEKHTARPATPMFNQIHVVKLRESASGADRDEGIDADALRESTSQMIARWRNSVGLHTADDQLPLPGSSRAPGNVPVDMRPSARAARAPLNLRPDDDEQTDPEDDDEVASGEPEAVTAVIEALRGKARRKRH